MPITKQAIKRMKQNKVAHDRNRHYLSRMKSMVKLILGYAEKSEMDKAKKLLPEVTKSIDLAAKKNLIHKNNAARKKSRVQRALNAEAKAPAKAAPKAEKKEEAPAKEADKAE